MLYSPGCTRTQKGKQMKTRRRVDQPAQGSATINRNDATTASPGGPRVGRGDCLKSGVARSVYQRRACDQTTVGSDCQGWKIPSHSACCRHDRRSRAAPRVTRSGWVILEPNRHVHRTVTQLCHNHCGLARGRIADEVEIARRIRGGSFEYSLQCTAAPSSVPRASEGTRKVNFGPTQYPSIRRRYRTWLEPMVGTRRATAGWGAYVVWAT